MRIIEKAIKSYQDSFKQFFLLYCCARIPVFSLGFSPLSIHTACFLGKKEVLISAFELFKPTELTCFDFTAVMWWMLLILII